MIKPVVATALHNGVGIGGLYADRLARRGIKPLANETTRAGSANFV